MSAWSLCSQWDFHPVHFCHFSCHRLNPVFHETVIQFSLAVWFHSLLGLPAVGFKAWHTDVRYRTSTACQHLTTGSTIQSPMRYITYLNPYNTEQNSSRWRLGWWWWWWGRILLSTLNFTECVFEFAYQCACIWLDFVSHQLIGGAWLDCPAKTSYAHFLKWPRISQQCLWGLILLVHGGHFAVWRGVY